jgi:hypothetical protein
MRLRARNVIVWREPYETREADLAAIASQKRSTLTTCHKKIEIVGKCCSYSHSIVAGGLLEMS